MSLTYGSVCSGIESVTEAWNPLGWIPKFLAEIDDFPSAVLAHHHGSNMPGEAPAKDGVPNLGDFTKIGPDAGPVDILVGGTPCQSFSLAGKRLGLDDPRGNLALEFLGLARRLCARWIVWENVPGVLSSYSGEPESEDGVRRKTCDIEAGVQWDQDHDLATFLTYVQECGFGFAYRVLDTQYVRTERFPRAVPQRRRRVVLVGYLGDWRRAAAVLFEPEGLRGDPPPRRQSRQSVAGTLGARATGGGGFGTDFEVDGGIVPEVAGTVDAGMGSRGQPEAERAHLLAGRMAFGGNNSGGPIDVATALRAHPTPQFDFESDTFVADVAGPVDASFGRLHGQDDQHVNTGLPMFVAEVAHTLRGEGHDASDDGTGHGTPIVPIAFDSKSSGQRGFGVSDEVSPTLRALNNSPDVSSNAGGQVAVAIPEPYTLAVRGRGNHRNVEIRQDGSADAVLTPNGGRDGVSIGAVAFAQNSRDEVRMVGGDGSVSGALGAEPGMKQQTYVARDWAVRRLTPTECARLQGFDDDHCRIPWNGKDADQCPDGHQYKAYGNAMPVNIMEFVGRRIDLMERLEREGRL